MQDETPLARVNVSQVTDRSNTISVSLRSGYGWIMAQVGVFERDFAVLRWVDNRLGPLSPLVIVSCVALTDFLDETRTEDGHYMILWRGDDE
jgi:hypothetical protein